VYSTSLVLLLEELKNRGVVVEGVEEAEGGEGDNSAMRNYHQNESTFLIFVIFAP